MAILAQYEQGIKVTDICREHGISQPTFCQYRFVAKLEVISC